jgi:hypothetical protein
MISTKMALLGLFALCFTSGGFSQKVTLTVYMEKKSAGPASDTVYYDTDKKLRWEDFHGKVPAGAPWGAMTSSGFSFNSSMNNDGAHIEITVGIYTFFTRHDSWKKPEIHSAYHLEHEQHHFDITRLGAARLLAEIRKAHFSDRNYRQVLNAIFDRVYDETIALQHQYDKETKNSMDSLRQIEWNKKISGEIADLESGTGALQSQR